MDGKDAIKAVSGFDRSGLKKVETKVKNSLPTADDIQAEKK